MIYDVGCDKTKRKRIGNNPRQERGLKHEGNEKKALLRFLGWTPNLGVVRSLKVPQILGQICNLGKPSSNQKIFILLEGSQSLDIKSELAFFIWG